MQESGLSVTIAYPDGEQISFAGQGAIVYMASAEDTPLFAITGRFTLIDAAQLIHHLFTAFGEQDALLAVGLALIAQRMDSN